MIERDQQNKIQREALNHLKRKATAHSKIQEELYNDLHGKDYFFDRRITDSKAKLLFQFRTRMYGVRNNFRNMYSSILCPLCGKAEDSQEHLFECDIFQNYETISIGYEDLFSDDIEKLIKVTSQLEKLVKVREVILDGSLSTID